MKNAVLTEKAPQPIGPYSQAIVYNDTLYISGQIAIDMSTGALCSGSIGEQTTCVLRNLSEIASKAGADLRNAVKTTIFLTDINDFGEVNAAYAAFFPDQQPARSCFAVAALPKDAKVEIEAICAMR